ncbi:fumarylacetoacetate hydrolase family protein [Agromyces atrinae]|uniref:2-keto-4-pentenoate hydratase/2-oxohepta-3-ene-1,7-dioic acid hydratase in catechol pathway n=1 Tax=Agromyces atrinae TaxID=592376 RepID=A0A4V1R273_9MICO|nr:fumarylacetoacetate hydrolase family protein [Agromyces atrinae]NYD65804.1 2-keto-4-pentenoate hydratase/2-oxohepta-3-ene-1,7-dioic acid hydratase in catechol pathway [Agromyces atrinae]RXZ86156.1 fumarylacetoacetate hydrolase family protein [Agromyces atrinae]
MRFAHLRVEGRSIPRLAVVEGDSALFLDELDPDAPTDLQELIDRGPAALDRVRELVDEARAAGIPTHAVSELRHSSAVLRPPHILAIGANYAAHASELKLRSESAMTVFSLWPNSLTAHGATTTWPEDLSTQVDYEAELGVIIGRPARNVSVRDALDHVWGYTVVNDITARDLQFSEAQWSRCKSFDGFTPTGPVVVTADEVADPQDLWLTTNVDGRLLQDASTGDMVRSVAEIISYLSKSATIPAGTLISTGSPGGAGYSRTPPVFLRDGSTVTVSIVGFGSLTTHCRVI